MTYDPDAPRRSYVKSTLRPSGPTPSEERTKFLLRLRDLAGTVWIAPRGTWCLIGHDGLTRLDGKGSLPWGNLSTWDLQTILRGTDREHPNSEADIRKSPEVEESWARREIEEMRSRGESEFRVGIARVLFRKCFRKAAPGDRPKMAEVERTPPKKRPGDAQTVGEVVREWTLPASVVDPAVEYPEEEVPF